MAVLHQVLVYKDDGLGCERREQFSVRSEPLRLRMRYAHRQHAHDAKYTDTVAPLPADFLRCMQDLNHACSGMFFFRIICCLIGDPSVTQIIIAAAFEGTME